MALKDLKSDLSKFRKPFNPPALSKQVEKQQPQKFSTTPLSDRMTPNVSKLEAAKEKTGTDVTGKNPTGRHTKGVDVDNASSPTGRHTEGVDVRNTVKISGRHTEGTNVENTVPLSGRHTTGTDVRNTVAITGRHTTGTDVENNVPLSGRHTTGKDVDNTSALSGRHTIGKDVSNTSAISGRHESDNSNFNIDGKPNGKSPIGRHDSGDTSNFNIDGVPTGKSPIGRHDGPDTSNFNIDGTPTPTNPAGRHDGPDTSNLNYDGTIQITNPRGRHDSGDTSIHNIDGTPVGTNPGGRHEFDNSILNIDGNPTPTNPGGRHETDNSNYNIDGVVPGTNPRGRHETSPILPNEVNYIPDIHASGFTSNFQPGTPTKYNIGSSQLQTPQSGPLAVDFIGNSGATGFTIKQETTSFTGINNTNYTLPTSVKGGRLWNVGKSKLDAQLGEGTFVPNAGALVGHDVKLAISGAGFSSGRKYDSVVGKNKVSALGHQYVQKNSPSFFDVMYNKFNLRDDAPQIGWIDSPLILRGIQRKNNSDTQRWGFGIGGFDDGLTRGGTVTALDRSIIDTVRIAKWMASPKGLMWIIKQVGLGLTNPKVETNPFTPGPFARQTRIHTGLASLLSVPGSAFGLHFTRHGIPFLNEIASYGAVQGTKVLARLGDSGLKFGLFQNRLVNLRYSPDSLTGAGLLSNVILPLSGLAGPQSVYGIGATTIRRYVNTNDAINDIAYKTIYDEEFRGLVTHDIVTQYAGGVSNSKYKTLSPLSFRKYTAKDVDKGGLYGFINNPNNPLSGIREKYPIVDKPVKPESNPTARSTNKDSFNNIVTGIKAYSTLAYNQIPDRNKGEKIGQRNAKSEFLDFRQEVITDLKKQGNYIGFPQNNKGDYSTSNLRDRFGFGDHGKAGQERYDFTKTNLKNGRPTENFRGDLVNLFDYDSKGSVTTGLYDKGEGKVGAKDFIPLFFTGPKLVRGEQKEETLVFRSTISNITDNFQPNWNSTQILGRADAVHTYNSWGRTFSFDFKVFATSRDEMRPLWRKLNYLASWTAPRYNSGKMRGSYMRITLGNLFQETPCFIDSLTYSTDDGTTWEINLENDETMLQLPHGINVSITLTMLMDYRPQWGGRMYSMSPRGSHTSDPNKNWLYDSTIENFRTFSDAKKDTEVGDGQKTKDVDSEATENKDVDV